ncbi:MAG: hypothetical protein K8F91_09425 [Candidatus Obscuribacterales bacterium]|nr:hypothetical protein [Candidatus Obscuribacterales bacterium]
MFKYIDPHHEMTVLLWSGLLILALIFLTWQAISLQGVAGLYQMVSPVLAVCAGLIVLFFDCAI